MTLLPAAASIWGLAVFTAAASAQEPANPADRFRAVKGWVGRYTLDIEGEGRWSAKDGGTSWAGTIDVQRKFRATVKLDKKEGDADGREWDWRGGQKTSVTAMHRSWSKEIYVNRDWKRGDPDYIQVTEKLELLDGSGNSTEATAGRLTINFRRGRYEVILLPVMFAADLKIEKHTVSRLGKKDDEKDATKLQSAAGAVTVGHPVPPQAIFAVVPLIDAGELIPNAADLFAAAADAGEPLPDRGFVLTGRRDWPIKIPSNIPGDGAPGRGRITLTWNFHPDDLEELDVVVDPAGYRTWLPQGTPDEEVSGGRIAIQAELKTKEGGVPQQRADRFKFELIDVSREPGTAMNFPVRPAAPRPDLRFEERYNPTPGFVLDPPADGQAMEVRGGDLLSATGVVSSFDWGAWGKVKVTAYMPDGRRIVGFLKDDRNQTDIRLPKRNAVSKIGDYWKEQLDVRGLPDFYDGESTPAGDCHTGDGFTLYEEYRGFYVDRAHIEGNPKKKDLFIRNEFGGGAVRGIELFKGVSEMDVLYELRADEFRRDDRVMNFNHGGQTPRLADQCGVLIVAIPEGDAARAVGGPGTPRHVQWVEVPRSLRPFDFPRTPITGRAAGPNAQLVRDRLASTLAHELLHCCSVRHHGENDAGRTTWNALANADAQGRTRITVGGVEFTVTTESGGAVAFPPGPIDVYVGSPGQQHSGAENCVMRYDVATAYRSRSNPRHYYWARESTGTGLCLNGIGTGVNDPGRPSPPGPRYGNAGEGRGGCKYQICINDRMHPF